jgi:hypothetical protein
MTDLLIPGPGPDPEQNGPQGAQDDGHDAGAQRPRGTQRQRGKPPTIPSEAECLQAIVQAARLVAMGLFTPSQANAIRAAFRDVLQHHQAKTTQAAGRGVSDGDLLKVLQADPRLLNLLEPVLGPDQIELIMRTSGGGLNGQ